MEQILGPLQKMYLILCLAEGMRNECAGKEDMKADYQIHSRIYENAFASMIRYGVQPICEARDDVTFLTVSLEGHIYGCPVRTVKNIMKAEFASVEEKLPGLAAMIQEEKARATVETKLGKKRKKLESSGDMTAKLGGTPTAQADSAVQGQAASVSVQEPAEAPVQERSMPVSSLVKSVVRETVQKSEMEAAISAMQPEMQGSDSHGVLETARIFKPQAQKADAARQGASVPELLLGIARMDACRDGNAGAGIEEALPDPAPGQMPFPTAGEEQPSVKSARQELGMSEDGSGITDRANTGDANGLQKKPATAHAFQRKQPQELPMDDEKPVQGVAEERQAAHPSKHADSAGKNPLGVLSRFLPKSKKQDVIGTIQVSQPVQDAGGTSSDMIPHAAVKERGERICHTHYIILRKTYGTQITGPYAIQVWPTEVIGMCPTRMPSAIFVRAQAPNGTVICKVNEGHTKYIVLDIDNKQFNVFGYWESGKFITEVSAINKTASIYTMSEDVEEECPENVDDTFLDQFRSREPHRPEFFVVPVSNGIPEGGTVPITAFIRVKDKNYPVTSKGHGDTLRFTYESQLSEISGWWEGGRFAFAVRAVEE